VKFVPKEQMENRRVVVCCNLKPAKMRDIMSYGMVSMGVLHGVVAWL
jgi:aminoacyl tRNA synthase complex-interacting multifunctional protein 1